MNKNFKLNYLVLFLLFILLYSMGYSQTASWISTSTTIYGGGGNSVFFGANGYLYTIDGGGHATESYEYAKMNADGSLGPWIREIHPSDPLLQLKGISGTNWSNKYLFAIGGYYQYPDGEIVYSTGTYTAGLSTTGSFNPYFKGQTGLNLARTDCGAVYANGFLYAIGGSACNSGGYCLNSFLTETVEFCKVSTDGSLGKWNYTSSLVTPSESYGGFAFDKYIYAMIGGQVERASQYSDGTLGPWVIASDTVPIIGPVALTTDLIVYVVGTGGHVFKTKLNPSDGTLGDWFVDTRPGLTLLTNFRVAAVWPYLYVEGGIAEYTQDTSTARFYDYLSSIDTGSLIFQPISGINGMPHLGYLNSFDGSSGVITLSFTTVNQGVKVTLNSPLWYSTISSHWYKMKARVRSDIPSPNDLWLAGYLYNGIPPDPTDINAHAFISVSTTWTEIVNYQQSWGGGGTTYPQFNIKNNSHSPATIYIDSLEIKEVAPPE